MSNISELKSEPSSCHAKLKKEDCSVECDPQQISLSLAVYSSGCPDGLYSLLPSCDPGWGQSHLRFHRAPKQQSDWYLDNNRGRHPDWTRFTPAVFAKVAFGKDNEAPGVIL